ncbi:Epoxide hydrolase A, partial [Linum perenne]
SPLFPTSFKLSELFTVTITTSSGSRYGYSHFLQSNFFVKIKFRKPNSDLQEVGEAEEEFAQVDTGKLINKLYTLFSKPDPPIVPKETGFKGLPESVLPWLPEEDVNYYASKFSKTGFTGGLNSYRAISLTGELMGPWVGSKYLVPAKFIVGDQDVVYHMPGMKEYIHSEEFKKDVPMLEEVVIMEGVSHFPNLVKPHEVTQHIFDFIKRF